MYGIQLLRSLSVWEFTWSESKNSLEVEGAAAGLGESFQELSRHYSYLSSILLYMEDQAHRSTSTYLSLFADSDPLFPTQFMMTFFIKRRSRNWFFTIWFFFFFAVKGSSCGKWVSMRKICYYSLVLFPHPETNHFFWTQGARESGYFWWKHMIYTLFHSASLKVTFK